MSSTDIDPGAVLDAIGITASAPPERITGGLDTMIWRFPTADGAVHALRLFRREQGGAAARERAALDAAHAAGVPAPKVETAGVWQDRPVAVLSWSPGEPLPAALERRPWTLWRMGHAFGGAQARIHTVAAPSLLLEGARDRWLERAGPEEAATVTRLLAAQRSTQTLLHMDYHPLNVLTDSRRITAVLDWVNATAGDPRADVAWTAATLMVAPLPAGPSQPLLHVARRLLAAAWIRGYTSATGAPVRGMAPFLAWAGAGMLRDFEPRAGAPGSAVTATDLERIRRWTARWRQRVTP
jgi:aminoglycoside phosphotransferase (APT) family kinase protein